MFLHQVRGAGRAQCPGRGREEGRSTVAFGKKCAPHQAIATPLERSLRFSRKPKGASRVPKVLPRTACLTVPPPSFCLPSLPPSSRNPKTTAARQGAHLPRPHRACRALAGCSLL
eukprot:6604741-Pyramimonas_sp.AAC.1